MSMAPRLPARLLARVGDRYRDLRFTARQMKALSRRERERAAPTRLPLSELVSVVADASDEVLTRAQDLFLELLSSDPRGHAGVADAYPFTRYGPTARREGAEDVVGRFAREQYFVTKRALLMLGVDNPHLHREAFFEIRRGLENELGRLSAGRVGIDEAAVVAARYTREFLRVAPVLHPDYLRPTEVDLPLDANSVLASVVALVGAAATASAEPIDAAELYSGCIAAACACHEELGAMIAEDDGGSRLGECYRRLVGMLC